MRNLRRSCTLLISASFVAFFAIAPAWAADEPPPPPAAAAGDAAAPATDAPPPAAAEETSDEEVTDETCYECHLDPDTTKTVDGKDVPLVVDKKAFQGSVHAGEGCASCHEGLDPTETPHAEDMKPAACTTCHDDEEVTKQVHGGTGAPKARRPDCKDCHAPHAVRPAAEALEQASTCLACHTSIDAGAYAASAHGSGDDERAASCAECHGAHVITSSDDVASATHPGKLAATCGECHDEEARAFSGGMHWAAYRRGLPDAPLCTTCHDPHATPPPGSVDPVTSRDKANALCLRCHLDGQDAARRPGDRRPQAGFIQAYIDSVHGQKRADGTATATCVDCHGAHGPGNRWDDDSELGRARTHETCGRCHTDVRTAFEASIHGQLVTQGNLDSATCTDCHGEHGILRSQDPRSRANAARLSQEACGVCHGSVRLAEKYGESAARLATYEDSYHGLAVVGGSVRAANCASCHGYHDILPSSDPTSRIHPDNLKDTCGVCHEGATDSFARIPVHATYERASHPIAFTLKWVYIALILAVIGGMLLHNVIIYVFHIRKKWAHEKALPSYQRYRRFEVVQHIVLAVTFITLVVTGFALKFPDAFWVWPLKQIGFDEEIRRWAHRIAAMGLTLASLVQAGYFVFHKGGRREALSILPRASDLVDFWHNMLYHFGRRSHPPRFDRFDYAEKAEYLALIWGTAVMAVTGFVLWFPELVTPWAPWWLFDVAQVVHYFEAWLATLAILVWHGFFVFLHPKEWPMSMVWLKGQMPIHDWKERHPLEYERETGKPAFAEDDDETSAEDAHHR